MHDEQIILLELVAVIALGGAAQWLAWRVRLPSILLLLLVGFVAGPVARELLPGTVLELDPDRLFGPALLPMVSLSVAVILFEGGLTLNFRELRRTGGVVRNLVTIGTAATWVIAAAAACLLLGLEWRLAVLVGAILVVTGPTVITPLLRHVRPIGPVGTVLKWEGIVIDPLGALLTVLTFEVLFADLTTETSVHLLMAVLKTVLLGGGLGLAAAVVLALAMARYWVPEFLHNAVALFLVCGVFALSNVAQAEAGLLAVTVMGVALANQRWADMHHIREFKENLRVFLISALFILLAARLRLEDLRGLGWPSVVFVAVLVVAARPVSVLLSTLGSQLRWRERLFLAWLAPRGIVAAAVASVFAIRLEQAGSAQGRLLVPLVFVAIVGTVSVYGLTAAFVAQRLGLAEANPQGVLIVGAHRLARELGKVLLKHKFRVLLVDTNRGETHAAKMADLPAYHGNVLSDEALEEFDLGGLGRLLALTPNDEVNVLAVRRFAPLFGRASVYQLPPPEGGAGRIAMDKRLHGRWLFHPTATAEHLLRQLDAGAVIKATKLSAEFDYAAFHRMYSPTAILLLVITENGKLNIRTAEETTEPKPGQTLVSLVFEKDETPKK